MAGGSALAQSWRDVAGSPFVTRKREATASLGMVASNHPMASSAGVEMLAMGGNAIDDAVATAFALTVVEPMMIGIFGSGFVNFYSAETGEVVNIDNYAVAPAAATSDMYRPISNKWPDYLETEGKKNRLGYLAVGVPGALKGWCYVEETYGKLGLDAVMQPTIRYAERGFPASPFLVDIISANRDDLAGFPASAEIFLPDGAPPAVGQAIVRSDYADTLRTVAVGGSDVLYHGGLGQQVVADMAASGGIITAADLEAYEIRKREPVRGDYRGHEIVSVGPTSSGGTHIVQALTSKKCAAARRNEIDIKHAGEFRPGNTAAYLGESTDTTHLTVADAEGNVVSMTQTIHEAFGSKVTVPGTGILLNNNMYIFDPHPGHANSIAPGKRMLSNQSPTIVLKDGQPLMALGTPGGTRIFPSVLQAIVNVIDHGMSLQEAVEAPRLYSQGQELEVEDGIVDQVRDRLAAMGHDVRVVARLAGGMNGIMFDAEAGVIHGAACWRADGTPIGISGGLASPGTGATYRV